MALLSIPPCFLFLGKNEGKLAQGGMFTDPGGDACHMSLNAAGKHKFKFGRCTMCKKSEHGGNAAAAPKRPTKATALARDDCPPHLWMFGKW